MWRTRDFDEVGRHLQRLRGHAPNGSVFEIGQRGNVSKIATTLTERAQVLPSKGDADNQAGLGFLF